MTTMAQSAFADSRHRPLLLGSRWAVLGRGGVLVSGTGVDRCPPAGGAVGDDRGDPRRRVRLHATVRPPRRRHVTRSASESPGWS